MTGSGDDDPWSARLIDPRQHETRLMRFSSIPNTVDRPPAPVPETRFGRWFLRTPVWTRYVVEAAIDQLLRLLPHSAIQAPRILDAGCGAGVALPLLERRLHAQSILAIDIDAAEIERCRASAARCSCPVQLVVGDASRTALPDCSIDMIFCHQILHHTRAQEAMLSEFYRVLVPGGWLLLAESCRSFILSTPVRLLFRHPNEVQRTAAGFQELVHAAGFEFESEQVEVSTPFWSLPDWGLMRRLGWRPGNSFEPTQITLVAVKRGS